MTRAEDDAAATAKAGGADLAEVVDGDVLVPPRPVRSHRTGLWTPAGTGRPLAARRQPWLSAVGDPSPANALDDVVERAGQLGLRRIDMVAWRDLDDPEAGGSELHAHEVATRWAAAGLDVHLSTSAVPGVPAEAHRAGYAVTRRWGRYAVFPRMALANLVGGRRARDGLVEIWNGMPFLSPLWAGCPHVVFLHHVHTEMWPMVLPKALAAAGDLVERRLAPPLYRTSKVVTLSASSRDEIVERLGLRADRVAVVPPGVDGRFTPGASLAGDPLVVAVGRLVPVKRFDQLIDGLVALRTRRPRLRAVIVGEGYEGPRLQAQVDRLDAGTWLQLPGRLDDEQLVDLYRQAWVLVSTSRREGWGMTITEAAACGTPAVVSRIAGHVDAVDDGRTGLLVDGVDEMVAAVDGLLGDDRRRASFSRRALERVRKLTWEATAAGTLDALVAEAAAARRALG